MWTDAAHLLACPVCRAPLRERPPDDLACSACARPWRVEAGVPRLLPPTPPGEPTPPGAARAGRTVRAFERQWRAYGGLRRLFGKDPAAMAGNLTGARISRRIDPPWYRGRRVLDAGCGHGRYLQAFAHLGAELVVGLDAGREPPRARAAIARAGIARVQGSVLAPPFLEGTFDLIFCDGVLHHTPDPGRAFGELARLLRPGGALYVWVYPREGSVREALFGAVRALTTRLPGPLLRGLCFALAPLTVVVRSYSATRLGRATWAECAQVVHDWLAPPIQSHHDYAEVAGWAVRAGLVDLERLPVPTGLTAWRPPDGA